MNLSERHMQILVGLAAGFTLREIAAKLWIQYATARNHSIEMQRRLGARTLPHAMAIAHRKGLLTAAGRPS